MKVLIYNRVEVQMSREQYEILKKLLGEMSISDLREFLTADEAEMAQRVYYEIVDAETRQP